MQLIEELKDFLFVIFTVDLKYREPYVRCQGCREILPSSYEESEHLMGTIEFQGKYIPVIDPKNPLCGEPTRLSSSSCIVIVDKGCNQQSQQTAVIIEDIEDVMNFAAGSFIHGADFIASVNMRFVLEMLDGDPEYSLPVQIA